MDQRAALRAIMNNSSRSGIAAVAANSSAVTTEFSGVQGVWYDPSDMATLFQDTAGTIPVTAAGQLVKKILDKSGNGNHATSSVGSVLELDGYNRARINFNGTTTTWQTASINFSSVDKATIYVGAYDSTSGTSIFCELSTNANENAGSFFVVSGDGAFPNGWDSLCRGTAAASTTQIAGDSSGRPNLSVLAFTHDIAGSLSTCRKNGVAKTSGTGSKGTGNLGNYPLYLGSRAGSTYFFSGKLYSLIIFGALHNATQITNIETYVNAKTGAF